MYVYLLNDYQEHGPENLAGTLDRSTLCGLIERNWPLLPRPMDWQGTDERWVKQEREYREYIESCRNKLRDLLLKTDEELAEQGSYELGDGWGAIQLHVVKLAE